MGGAEGPWGLTELIRRQSYKWYITGRVPFTDYALGPMSLESGMAG